MLLNCVHVCKLVTIVVVKYSLCNCLVQKCLRVFVQLACAVHMVFYMKQ